MSAEEITVEVAAEKLAVSEASVRRYCRQGKLQARKVSAEGRQDPWVIDADSLQEFLETRSQDKQQSQQSAVSRHRSLIEADSILPAVQKAVSAGIREQIGEIMPRLPDPQAQENIQQALTANMERIQKLSAENTRLKQRLEDARTEAVEARSREEELEEQLVRSRENAEQLQEQVNALQAERNQLQEALEREKGKSWWDRLTGSE